MNSPFCHKAVIKTYNPKRATASITTNCSKVMLVKLQFAKDDLEAKVSKY